MSDDKIKKAARKEKRKFNQIRKCSQKTATQFYNLSMNVTFIDNKRTKGKESF